jgi:hypothetical protein
MMIQQFYYAQDIGKLLLQEVTTPEFPAFAGYKAYVNVGTNQRGTAIVFLDTMYFDKADKVPSGRGRAAWFGCRYLVNIYAPSRISRRNEKEEFFF